MKSRACDSCYKRKIKCNTVRPRCNWCTYYDVLCTFSRTYRAGERKRRAVVRKEAETYMAERIVPSSQQVPFPGRGLEQISSYNGIPFFSSRGQQWVQSRTGESVVLDQFHDTSPPWQKKPSSWPSPSQRNPIELPGRNILEKYLAIYEASAVCLVFPLVDPTLFPKTISLAYLQSQAQYSNSNASRKASIFAFLAFCSIINLEKVPQATVDSEEYAAEVQRLLPEVMHEIPTLDGLQSLLMLSLYHTLSGDCRSADVLIGNAARLIFMLGGNLCFGNADSHLRNLFWVCYVIDKDLSLRTGRPPSLGDDDCDLTLPNEILDYTSTNPMSPQSSAGTGPRALLFPSDLRLSMVTSKIYRALYSVRALKKSDTELLRTIRELDDDLEQWRSCLLAPDMLIGSLPNEAQSGSVTDIRLIMLRLQYHHCMAAIHQASSRCKAGTGDYSGIREAISSSQELSIEASRSLILCLRAVNHALQGEYFWFILFYPMSALLAIFRNLLRDPQAPQRAGDLELLSDAPVCIWRNLAHQPSHNILQMKPVVDFMSELNRLAICAILKAGTEIS